MKRCSWISSGVRVYSCGKKSYEAGGHKAVWIAVMPAWMCKKPGTVTRLLQIQMCALHSSLSSWGPFTSTAVALQRSSSTTISTRLLDRICCRLSRPWKTLVIVTCMRLLTVVREVVQESIHRPTDWGIWLSWCLGFAGTPAAHSSELSHFPGRATTLTIPTLPSEPELGRHCRS